ncbi:hypothetical protein [Parafrankia sp. FMc2]|uniref:hypothetical protein n=1 Tax=Parafrankia sp. FMc2 TaxID=3233196 RepID=UPI0034D5500B
MTEKPVIPGIERSPNRPNVVDTAPCRQRVDNVLSTTFRSSVGAPGTHDSDLDGDRRPSLPATAAGIRAESLARVQQQIATARRRGDARRAADRQKRARRSAGVDARNRRKLARLTAGAGQETNQ